MTQDTQLDTLRGTILAVDDSPTIRKLVSMTMEGQGYRVVVAADGIEALAILKTEHPDLILCDVAMPKLDGYQLCKIIRNSPDTKHIPVVMLSGKDGLFDKVRGRMAGCSSYITKPFEPDLLISEVRKYVKPALIPMSPHKPRKKASEPVQDAAKKDKKSAATPGPGGPEDSERLLAQHLSGLVTPDTVPAVDTAGTQTAGRERTPAPEPEPTATPSRDEPPKQPRQQEPGPRTLSAVDSEGTVELDKLLNELERSDDMVDVEPPRTPFRSRCPGCRTVFRNIRPADYDKHARCRQCGTRFHLGDHLAE